MLVESAGILDEVASSDLWMEKKQLLLQNIDILHKVYSKGVFISNNS